MQATEYLKEIFIEDRVLNREDLSEYWKSVSELMEEYHQSKLRQDSNKLELTSIFIVTYEQTETRGHGDFGKIKKLSTYDGYNEKQYPAFKSREDAQNFIDKVSKYLTPQITELTIWNGQ